MNFFLTEKKWKLRTLFRAFLNPFEFKPFFGQSLQDYYINVKRKQNGLLEEIPLKEIADLSKTVKIQDYIPQGQNMTIFEILCIASIIATSLPKSILEIGTYDGNTTMQMSLNMPEGGRVHTLDLPIDQLDYNLKKKRFEETDIERVITQHYGNSKTYNFTQEGPFDLIFIDADHTYEFVKADTENAFKNLSPGGCILWHDYTPEIQGVFYYLHELSKDYPIKRIEGTNLAIYDGREKPAHV